MVTIDDVRLEVDGRHHQPPQLVADDVHRPFLGAVNAMKPDNPDGRKANPGESTHGNIGVRRLRRAVARNARESDHVKSVDSARFDGLG